jgi:hypothetical protein
MVIALSLMRRQLLLCAALLLSAPPALAKARADDEEGPFVLLFVGGAGGDDSSPTLTRLKDRLQSLDPKHGLLVFTGNYGDGELPAEGGEGRSRAEGHILAHVDVAQDFVKRGGKVFFLAGQRDFAGGGTKAVRRLRDFLNQSFETALGAGDSDDANDKPDLDVMPQAGCGDTTLLELNDRLGLLLLDSQWWMQDWANDPQANEECEVKTRADFHATFWTRSARIETAD